MISCTNTRRSPFYYCCTRDPIPVRILLRAMLLDGAMLLDDANGYPNSSLLSPVPRRTKAEIHALLLRRQCLAVTKRRPEPEELHGEDDDDDNDDDENEQNEKDNAATTATEVTGDFVVDTTGVCTIFR